MNRPVMIKGCVFCLDDVRMFYKVESSGLFNSVSEPCIVLSFDRGGYTIQFKDAEKRDRAFQWLADKYNYEEYIDEDDEFFEGLKRGLEELKDE